MTVLRSMGGLALAGLALVGGLSLLPRPGPSPDPAPGDVVALVGQAYPSALRQAMAATRAAPLDPSKGQAAARALIHEGRLRGDSRLVGAAVGVLRPFLADPSAETLYLAATARQYQHDFPGALALLDQALRLAPSDTNARLTRATIRTVLGDYPAARVDCAAIDRPDVAFLCAATTETLTANGPALAARLEQILARPGLLDPGLRGWALGLVAEIALHRGDRPKARAALEQVLAADPGALRERLMLADLLLVTGAPQAARDLLAPAPDTDGVLIRRALAARALQDPGLKDLAQALQARVRQNLDLGLKAHAREEALYFLLIARDPAQALARARINWDLQHEAEDAALLRAAAQAAGAPEAAAPVQAWSQAHSVLPPADAGILALP